jgi:hypothetical protein
MGLHSLSVADVATGAVVGTYKSLLGLKFANTAARRGRVRKLVVAPSGEAAQDVNVSVRLTTGDNSADGTATAATVKAYDTIGAASLIANAYTNYTVEPTTVASVHFVQAALNGRGGLVLEWGPGEGPAWGQNVTLLLQASPGAASAVKVSVTVEWEE